MTKTVRFLHLDDEIVRISWIPSALRTFYFQRNRQLYRGAAPLREDAGNMTWSFTLPSEGDANAFEVTYCAFTRKDELLKLPAQTLRESTIILDLMGPAPQGGQCLSGIEAWEALRDQQVPATQVFMLTAFEAEARQHLQSQFQGRILAKPIDARTLAPLLLKAAKVLNDD